MIELIDFLDFGKKLKKDGVFRACDIASLLLMMTGIVYYFFANVDLVTVAIMVATAIKLLFLAIAVHYKLEESIATNEMLFTRFLLSWLWSVVVLCGYFLLALLVLWVCSLFKPDGFGF